MKKNVSDIDKYTREILRRGEILQPRADFTKNVMSKILKDPSVNVHFVTKDDKESNIWLFLSVVALFVGYLLYFIFKGGFSGSSVKTPEYISFFTSFFKDLWSEISISPYIIIALVGVIVLVILDRTIVKYLYSL